MTDTFPAGYALAAAAATAHVAATPTAAWLPAYVTGLALCLWSLAPDLYRRARFDAETLADRLLARLDRRLP